MSSLNQVILMGHLGKDPKVLNVTKQGQFVQLSLATNQKYTSKEGEEREDVQWHTVYLSNGTGVWAADTLKKGDKIFISGELRHRSWKDKDGQLHYATGVYAKEIKCLSVKPKKDAAVIESLNEKSVDEIAENEKSVDDIAEEENRWVLLDLFHEESQ